MGQSADRTLCVPEAASYSTGRGLLEILGKHPLWFDIRMANSCKEYKISPEAGDRPSGPFKIQAGGVRFGHSPPEFPDSFFYRNLWNIGRIACDGHQLCLAGDIEPGKMEIYEDALYRGKLRVHIVGCRPYGLP